jgi:predicted transcriptional regulator
MIVLADAKGLTPNCLDPMIPFDKEHLKAGRLRLKLSQRAFAAAAGVSQALIAELEIGKHPPSAATWEKITKFLDEG